MPSLSQLLALPIEAAALGRHYRLSPLTLADLGAIERRIIECRHEPADESKLRDLGESAPSISEIAGWVGNREGTHYTIWLSLRRRHPRVTLDEAASLVESLASEAPPAHESDCIGQARGTTESTLQPKWAPLLDHFAVRFGWTPSKIGSLTLAQAEHLIEASAGRPRIALLSRSEVRQFCRAKMDSPPAPKGTHESLPGIFDEIDPQSRRLAWFRRGIPEVYAPLTAAALSRLAAAIERLNKPRMARRYSGDKRRHSDIHGRIVAPNNGGRLIGVARKLDVLIETIRHNGGERRASIPFDPAAAARFQ